MINNLSPKARSVMEELKEKAKLKPGDIVVGCSTSEIIGGIRAKYNEDLL